MKMVAHKAIGMNLPVRFCASLGQGFENVLAINVIHEDIFTAVPTSHHMVNRAGIFDPQLPWHSGRKYGCHQGVKQQKRTMLWPDPFTRLLGVFSEVRDFILGRDRSS